MCGILTDIPEGKFRVVKMILMEGESSSVGDYPLIEAENLTREHNRKRKGRMDEAYWLYNDQGTLLLNHEGLDLLSAGF